MLLSCCMMLHCTVSTHGFSCLSCIDTKYSDPKWLAWHWCWAEWKFERAAFQTLNYLLLYLEWTVGYLHSWRTLFWVLHPPQMVKSFMKLGVKFYSFSREKGWNFFPFHRDSRLSLVTVISVRWKYFGQGGEKTMLGICFWKQLR